MLEFSSEVSFLQSSPFWLYPQKPKQKKSWQIIDSKTNKQLSPSQVEAILANTTRFTNWSWPQQKIHFISDIHADEEALISSLLMSGLIKKTGLQTTDFILTRKGQNSCIVIGGDCLDKGPSNLGLLRTIKSLIEQNPNTILLAGNHDMRLYMGLKCLERTTSSDNQFPINNEHFFIRMGPKVLPLLKEVYDEYVSDYDKNNLPSKAWCKAKLFPSEHWQSNFQKTTQHLLCPLAIQREFKKIHKKRTNFGKHCKKHGLTLPMVYIAAKQCYELFLKPKGEFYWFFNTMQMSHREGSFLFVHAGLDDTIIPSLQQLGSKGLNQQFNQQIKENLCEFYYGSLANMLRTKYRKHEPVLTNKGVKRLHKIGVHAIVHGHVSQTEGQRITIRSDLLHFECDITLDKNSRTKEHLSDIGAGITTISPKGKVKAISTDASYVKVFQPDLLIS